MKVLKRRMKNAKTDEMTLNKLEIISVEKYCSVVG